MTTTIPSIPMAASIPSILILLILLSTTSEAKLSLDYYKSTCPKALDIISSAIVNKQINNPTTAAATVRLFFHDCFVGGCDASVLITSNSFNRAERDADINLSLPGDAFDGIVRAKAALELSCPGIVSCADILAVAARDLISMVGGPFYPVRLGRKDSFISKSTLVEGNLPRPTMSVPQMIDLFSNKGFTVQEMVALSGAHTIGFSHCKEFAARINGSVVSPSLNPRYAEGLKKACANYKSDSTIAVFNDVMTPNKFDNMYFQNLPRGLGLLASDEGMLSDPRTAPFVRLYAMNQTAFFDDFVHAMQKLSVYGVKTGRRGEVRRRCDEFNNLTT
ncbi:Peroxidase 63 [Acorus calamus]|uniref:Peroxidase n=1 Tax=Acorus calamus TaxID=4465 RepID=A0AAV9D3I7_ACOCL|nr:Peroxidase 63 [Acorus calamus]